MSQPILDAGEKIGGARKDLVAAARANQLGALTEAEKAELITKDAAWPKPDWAALVEEGMEAGCAALLKIARDRLPARPVVRGGGFEAACDGYMNAMRVLREEAAKCRTPADAQALERRFHARTAMELGPTGARHAFMTLIPGRTVPFHISSIDGRRASTMLTEGFPGQVPPWRKGVRALLDRDGTWRLRDRAGWVDLPRQPSEEAAWKAAEERWEKLKSASRAARAGLSEMPARPHLRDIERNGMDVRPAGRIDAEDFLGAFGFRGVEFGEWLPQDERQAVLDHAWDALHDLSIATGLEPHQLSLGGSLALAFGARGTGGAAAHYEPGRKVVNLTRMSGAGSLAHEWGHAFDHWLGMQGGAAIEAGQPRFASGYRTRRDSRLVALRNLPPACAQAADNLAAATWSRRVPLEERLRPVLEARAEAEASLRACSPWSAEATAARARLHSLGIKEQGIRSSPGRMVPTSFYQQAAKLSGTDGYHARPTEMWARSFESMVFDALQEAGMRSDYLVQGVEEDRFAGGQWRGNPYPEGDERQLLNGLHVQMLAHARALLPAASISVPIPC